jgi:hypothetical protein
MSTNEILTEIEIHASSERVWQVLSDFDAYPHWNPFIRRIEGELRVGARLRVFVQPAGRKGMSFRPTVTLHEPKRALGWLGRLWVPGLFDGEHSFTIDPVAEERVRFVHAERFTGLLVPLAAKMLDQDIRRGFEEMNRALKLRSEADAED